MIKDQIHEILREELALSEETLALVTEKVMMAILQEIATALNVAIGVQVA